MATSPIDTKAIVRICRAGGAVRVALFESTARGEALGRDVDLLTEATISPYLRERIEREQKVLYDA